MARAHIGLVVGLLSAAYGYHSGTPIALWVGLLSALVSGVWLCLVAMVHRDLTLAKDHWSRNPANCKPVYQKTHHPLSKSWRFECSKPSSADGPMTGIYTGRQTWAVVDGPAPTVDFRAASNPNSSDKLYRSQMYGSVSDPATARGDPSTTTPEDSLRQAADFYGKLQAEDGHWPGDYGGPFFLMPFLIIACHITGHDLGADRRDAMTTYFRNHQQEDGGWGLHLESPSTMFGSVLAYVSLRIFGHSPDSSYLVKCRDWIQRNGGATTTPSWGKFWLACLGVFEWEGCNPTPPELWLLPYAFPFHPARMWCHARMVYLPMSYLFGRRATVPASPLTAALRKELYVQPYESINWRNARMSVCVHDLYSPHTWLCDRAFDLLSLYESYHAKGLRRRGLDFAAAYIHAEDLQTNYVDIGPVNKVLNMLSIWYIAGGPNGGSKDERFLRHLARIEDYLWVAEDGMKMSGYNGSQLWDTAFATQALLESGIAAHCQPTIERAHGYIATTQIRNDVPHREQFFRHISKGGWPFSTADHGWPISDCTAEGLKVALGVRKAALVPDSDLIPFDRLCDAVNILLSFQNDDGGWATYELNRGWSWFEWFNPAEVFGDIMIDYTYVECSSACITALAAFHAQFPEHRTGEVTKAIARGGDFIRAQQRPDGSWYGSWAICFTYAAWFGVEALHAVKEPTSSPRFRKACEFLLSKQNSDGGWGESYLSCVTKEYVQAESQVVNTGWALLALMGAHCEDTDAVRRGIDFLMSKQLATGDWAQERVSGIFNRTCGITYTAYRNVFPLWALGKYTNEYAPSPVASGGSAPAPAAAAAAAAASGGAAAPSSSPVTSRRGGVTRRRRLDN